MKDTLMASIPRWLLCTLLLAVAGLAVLPGSRGAVPDARGEKQARPAFVDQAVYLACGEVRGPGEVTQLAPAGTVLGRVALPGTPYGLAAGKQGLIAAVPSRGEVLLVDAQGQVKQFHADPKDAPHPIAVAANPASGDVLVADNQTNTLTLLPAGEANKGKTFPLARTRRGMNNMSVGLTGDGMYLFGASGPDGVYRFPAGKGIKPGEPQLPKDGDVAGDPSSARWAARQPRALHVFAGDKEEAVIAYPNGQSAYFGGLAFAADGTLVVALNSGPKSFQVSRADVDGKGLRPLFAWNESRVLAIAIGPRTAWKMGKE